LDERIPTYDIESFTRSGLDPVAVDKGLVLEQGGVFELYLSASRHLHVDASRAYFKGKFGNHFDALNTIRDGRLILVSL
jgi:hypothetical protein